MDKNIKKQREWDRELNGEEDFGNDPKKTGYLRNSVAVLNFLLRSLFLFHYFYWHEKTEKQRDK